MKTWLISLVAVVSVLFWVSPAQAQNGMSVIKSPHDVATTLDNLTTILESKGMTVFGRVNHSANAQKVGGSLRATEVLIFGNPKIGTPLMNCSQTVAIDLPQKMLAWEDESGQTFLGWNDPEYLKSRHAIDGCDKVLETVTGALANFARAAIAE